MIYSSKTFTSYLRFLIVALGILSIDTVFRKLTWFFKYFLSIQWMLYKPHNRYKILSINLKLKKNKTVELSRVNEFQWI